MKTNKLFYFFILICFNLTAQIDEIKIEIEPYLQDATPSSIIIMWQTNKNEESIVEWGLTPKLGEKTEGIAYDVNFTEARIHEVTLKNLERFTNYYYRVKTGNTTSDIFQFKTPPFATDNKSFKIVAMSDMQYDHNQPDKFNEIINDGVLKFLKTEFKDSLPDNLALVMIPGDLVENGSKYYQWKDHFFKPSEKLFSNVPVYPVLGNHERNSLYYFKYFSLPKNGSPEYAEHWWYKDYGNTRIIGLDSNDGYRNSREQYNWLKDLLNKTAKNNDIDFVFAQLHHPHKSELWIPGEEDFTGKVVDLLEKFSTETGKPSIHFFGHTHGYSRGQSKDHKHLWVNVASAGGAIDNWGEFEGRDYDEFTVTQDEYGFVMVEVDANKNNPKFTLKRVSRGNTKEFKNNIITDSITIFKNEKKPQTPEAITPNNLTMPITGVVLKANNFKSSLNKAFHAASNWQVSTDLEFKSIVYDSWKQFENWYYKENRQEKDDLTDEEIEKRLTNNTTYYWRVRYRDQHLNWSNWSKTATFKTMQSKEN
ncbi:metallophosphoesterase family protein [Lutibacter sp. A64]|uniref:purple acid phosphatase family protein n=1 Tax=Lutibacter sp. A64 TaxID=2918526 RepID=UPI001F06F35B|nr:metallophosphoesterase family protein [Lutibacter sp. A64]UMB52747.1 metallophosphoesterase family protein [Lutibacter sp. A64]